MEKINNKALFIITCFYFIKYISIRNYYIYYIISIYINIYHYCKSKKSDRLKFWSFSSIFISFFLNFIFINSLFLF